MARLQDVILRGASGAQPAATTVPDGTLYFQTDTGVTQQSDGTNWNSYSPTTTGGNVTGTGLTSGVPIVGAGGSAIAVDTTLAVIRLARVVLTNAQIKALPTTPIELVPAQGANTIIRPLHIFGLLNSLAGAYTNISSPTGADLTCFIGSTSLGAFLFNDTSPSIVTPFVAPITTFSDTFGVAQQTRFSLGEGLYQDYNTTWGIVNYQGNIAAEINQHLTVLISNGLGNLTGGNVSNTLAMTVLYMVESV